MHSIPQRIQTTGEEVTRFVKSRQEYFSPSNDDGRYSCSLDLDTEQVRVGLALGRQLIGSAKQSDEDVWLIYNNGSVDDCSYHFVAGSSSKPWMNVQNGNIIFNLKHFA